jgi:pyruvate,water dikinase
MVGGKNANLGEMARIGIPVPDGFAITTEVYDRFMKETGATHEIDRYMKKFLEGLIETSQYQEASKSIRKIIEDQDIPQNLCNTIVAHYDSLCEKYGVADNPVAVRSSGVAEDSASASFAGQFESFLNVTGKDELLKKTKECWSSQFTTQAISYRIKNKLPSTGSSMSVVVQRMTQARAAGVGFTSHPITGDPSKIVLEGNWGLGESIVQGMVTPDKYVIDKGTLKLLEKKIADKDKYIMQAEQGVVTADMPKEKQKLPCLSDEEAMKLAEFAKALESHYGMPQDVEWAIDGDLTFPENIFFVQTRPITVSMEKKEDESTEYIADLMVQMFRQIRESEEDPKDKKRKK